MGEEKKNVKEAVREWLAERGYDYEVRTYMPDGAEENRIKKEKNTISIPAGVEDIEVFMEQFVRSFDSINKISELNKQV